MMMQAQITVKCIQDKGFMQTANEELLQKYGCECLLLIYEESNQVQVLAVSQTNQIRAVEIVEYMLSEFGLVRGEACRAEGLVSSTILRSQMSECEITDMESYFAELVRRYQEETGSIDAVAYAKENAEAIRRLPLYTKKKKKWAMVKSTDIVCAGEVFVIKSLENESGENIVAQDDVYIMIGSRGEVYHILAQKFENTYEITTESLDIFAEMLDFIPEVRVVATGEFIPIDEKAYICYPKQNVRIYAKPLECRTKVFQDVEQGNYFLGRPGDYMAVREDDLADIYIIQKEIFESTYEEVEEQ